MSDQLITRPRLRSLADDLRVRTSDELVSLIEKRPDVLRVIPTDIAELAVELARQQSVRAAVTQLSEDDLSLLTALCRDERDGIAADSDDSLCRLWDLALIWGGKTSGELDRIRPVSAVSGLVLSTSAAELAPRVAATHMLVGEALPRAEIIDSEAAAHALDFVTAITQLCEFWAREPAAAIQTGELAHRAIGSTATQLGIDEDQARRLIGAARDADLIDLDERGRSTYCPTLRYEAWKQCSTGEQWLVLLYPWIADSRLVIWDALATLPVGHAATSDSLMEFCASIRPNASAQDRAAFVAQAIADGEFVGVLSRGAVSGLGRVLLERALNRSEAIAAVDELLPATTDRFITQADLTLVVPAPPTPALRLLLVESAELESTGGAHVYRFTPNSIRWALHRHHGADALLATLRDHSLTPLPQPLEYLVGDAERAMQGDSSQQADDRVYTPIEKVDESVVIAALVTALLAVERADSAAQSQAPPVDIDRQSSVQCAQSLREAQVGQVPVWLEYADDAGSTSRRLANVVEVSGGVLTAFDRSTGRITRFALSRIAGVQLVQEGTHSD